MENIMTIVQITSMFKRGLGQNEKLLKNIENMNKRDEIRAHREELKRLWFSLDHSKTPVRKEIIVDLRYLDNKHWPNHGYVQIISDGPDGYSSFSTHQENPLQYAKDRMKEKHDGIRDLSKYKLVIKR